MNEIQRELTESLNRAAERMREAGLPNELVAAMERLAGQVDKPCVVAVVGQVKVGKSTFVNALLGGDLAKVGDVETTATINFFSYGKPPDPDRPVRCHWRGGKTTYEDRAFLDGLQGNDIETLRRADGVDHLEYLLQHSFLEELTLVDTPGTNAVVEEHQDRTAEFMKLHDQLRERHNKETQRLGSEADAVIYLTGAIAKSTEKTFLEEFRETTGGRSSALNAIGVMSKVELQPEILAQRHQLSGDIANQLREELNTVLPAGSGVRRSLDGLLAEDRAGLRRLMETLRLIPPERLAKMLKMDTKFLEREYADSPVSARDRRGLLEELPEDVRVWQVFATIARVAADPELETPAEVEARLEELSNFEALKEIINKHFIERGHILRCYRIVNDAREVIKEIKFTHLPQRKKEIPKERSRLDRFIALIQQAGGDPTTTRELEDFVYSHLDVNERVKELEGLHGDLGEKFDRLYHQLIQYNADFQALQSLEAPDHGFSEPELEELRPLLGLYGSEVEKRLPPGKAEAEYAEKRQLHWRQKMSQAPFGSVRQMVAERAYTRYGMVWAELYEREATGVPAGAGT